MTAAPHTTTAAEQATLRVSAAAWVVPLALYGLALAVRLLAIASVRFPLTEGSAYYSAVAQNLATGRGLVVDAIWSYATPPLVLPRPAFELWQPLASFLAAVPMPVLGASFGAAQLAFVLVGALLAPMTWYVARDAARRVAVGERRATTLSIGAGALAAICGPFLLATVAPDSTLPFTVLAVAACMVMPAALRGERRAMVGLGVLAGLAYLARMEGLYLGLTFVVLGLAMRLGWRLVVGRAVVIAAVAALVALPWFLRNLATFGTALPGQVADNLFATRNEQIFGYANRPALEGFLGQGPITMLANVIEAFRHDIVDVLLVPSVAVVVVAAIAMVAGRRNASALNGSSLAALLVLGGFTLVVTSVLFPVPTLWGTFEHAAGPLLVALIVSASLGADAFVARVRAWRNWPRSNAWLAPAALVALTVPLTLLQISGAAANAREEQQRFGTLAGTVPPALAAAGVADEAPTITDRPIWLSDALGNSAIALPDESATDVLSLARDFGAQAVVVVEERGRHPADLAAAADCFEELTPASGSNPSTWAGARVFVIDEACR